jgi:3-hydroxyisobutyrate dehydrogenase-like beta-hydroxyacid dehydrogenase
MATPNFIGEPGGTILYSGPRALFDANLPVFIALGGNPQFVGEDVGHASALDLSLLGQMWGALFGQLQAAAICEAEGIALDLFEEHRQAFLPVVEGAVVDLITRIRDRRFAADAETPRLARRPLRRLRPALAALRRARPGRSRLQGTG